MYFRSSSPTKILGLHSVSLDKPFVQYLTCMPAALETYVRRAYRAYTIDMVDYEEGDQMDDGEAPNILTWQFRLGSSNPPPSTPSLEQFGLALFAA